MITPFNLLVIAFAGWLSRHQQAAIDYLTMENRILKEQLGDQRIRFGDKQRIQLAVKAKIPGRQCLATNRQMFPGSLISRLVRLEDLNMPLEFLQNYSYSGRRTIR